MSDDALHERGKAMEDLFFHETDAKLLDRMKAELEADQDRSALVAATGISDVDVIEKLMAQGIAARTMAGIGLIPLVAVAWADGKMDDNERDAILKAAAESGIDEDHASFEMISNWLQNRPGDALLDSWKNYVGALRENLDATSIQQIQRSVLDRARRVADSAGGFLGLASTSAVEQKVLDDLDAAFK